MKSYRFTKDISLTVSLDGTHILNTEGEILPVLDTKPENPIPSGFDEGDFVIADPVDSKKETVRGILSSVDNRRVTFIYGILGTTVAIGKESDNIFCSVPISEYAIRMMTESEKAAFLDSMHANGREWDEYHGIMLPYPFKAGECPYPKRWETFYELVPETSMGYISCQFDGSWDEKAAFCRGIASKDVSIIRNRARLISEALSDDGYVEKYLLK